MQSHKLKSAIVGTFSALFFHLVIHTFELREPAEEP
jgi:hypothetical protein